MKTIKDLKVAIKDLPDDMPISMYWNGGSYYNRIWFHIKKLWVNMEQKECFVIDKQV